MSTNIKNANRLLFGDLMDNVFHYMLNGWAELQNYPMDGHYAIDNMIAERVQTFYCKQKNFVL